MQSLTQMMKSGPKPEEIEAEQKPVTTENTQQPLENETGVQPIESETETQVVDSNSAISLESETVITPDESEKGVQLLGGETLQTSGNVTATQALEMEPAVEPVSDPSHNTGGTAVDTTSKPSAPTELVPDVRHNPGCDAQEASKVDKVVPDRKYIPCKKDRLDPLKMDMSKPVVMPLTSSQLSLQCIECHIIFSDHKSKERHLKLSHPAEYEQCILRNALFACYVCDRHFTNSTELMAHQKAHIEKKPFKCPICGQAFNKSSELTLHKKIHFGRDGYACADCGKPCKTLTLLKYHRRTHTGERPYVCKECGKRFSMSKALQKHMLSHLPEDAEGDGGDTSATAKAQLKKNNGTTVKYPCSVCKATFKTTKTRLHHMKTKHNLLPAATNNATQAGQPVKEGIPIITPISICQPALLQMEPIGPLQQVDANIDTEQIRKLIESLGNVQKVNQVVILGQVPPNAPPLELQQISEPVNLNLTPSQVDLVEQTEYKTVELEHSKNPCESMEQTIILEPITPDGQLENPSFSELGSHIATPENIGLTLVEPEQTERHEGEMMHEIFQQPETGTVQSDSVTHIVCQSEVVDLKQNLEQTVILEFTSAFMPTVELEQSQSVPQSEMPSSSLVPSTELEKISDETVIGQQETNLSVPPLMPTVELELTPLQTDQQDLPACPFVPADAFTQTPSESQTNSKAEADSEIQTVGLDPVHSVRDAAPVEETHDKTQQEQSENLLGDSRENQEQEEKLSEADDPPAEKEVSQLQTEQVQQTSHIAVNAMSAQELVKVRKRKPARTFIFQENMQEFVGTTQNDDAEIDPKPAKRQRTKKSRLVVKFGPQNKEKKNKKQKKPSQPRHSTQEEPLKGKSSITNLSSQKVPSQKKGRKAKKDKKEGHSVSMAEIKSTSSTHNPQVQQIKEDIRKNKIKRKKDVVSDAVEHTSEQEIVISPVFKKKKQPKIMQKSQPKKTRDGKLTSKERKNKSTKEQKMNTEPSTVSANIPGPQITRDSLLLLKGHKQPQLKVHKLDPSKASSQTQEVLPHKLQTSQLSNDITLKQRNNTTNTSGKKLATRGGKKKGGRPKKNQKTLSLLSSLQVSTPPPETLPSKPKTTRKRKASLKVETEGIITSSHSRRALECKDCGERFSEVSSLQEHKTTAHVVESPGLTYTNGNIFEGVSRLDLGQPPERHDEPVGVMNAATGWDTEAELGEIALEERERSVSFPALNPSPSLPATAPDVEASGYEGKSGNTAAAEITPFMGIAKELPAQSSQCLSPPEVVSPFPSNADQKKMLESNGDAPPHFTSKTPVNNSTQTKGSEAGGALASEEDKSVSQSSRQDITKSPLLPSSESEIQGTTDEDIKEGLLLEVDLVTVGEQNERDDLTSAQDCGSQSKHVEPCNPESSSTDTCVPPGQIDNETTTEKSLTSQTVSCSTHEPEIKEEEEEILVQRKEEGMKGVVRKSVTRGRRRGTGRLKKAVVSRKSSVGDDDARGKEPEKDMDECQIVYQSCPLTSNSEINDEGETSTLHQTQSTSQSSQPEISPAPATSVPSIPSSSEESPEKQVVFELESVATSVVETTKSEERPGLEGAEEQDRDTGQSPGIILERFIASRQRETGDKEHGLPAIRNNERQGLDGAAQNEVVFREVLRGQEIKVEENISDPPLVAHTCQSRQRAVPQAQHQHDIRTVLVKQETSLVLSDTQATQGGRHIRWNVEQINTENTSDPLLESEEMTRDSGVAADFNTNQCIFYPVKEEEREVLLGASQSDSGALTVGVSSNARADHHTDGQHQPASSNLHEGSHATEDYQETTVRGVLSRAGVNNFENTAAEADVACEDTAELRDFLLQSSDNEDSDVFDLPDPQLDSEAEAMACYYTNQNSSPPQPDETSHNLPTSDSHLHSRAQREGNGSREPIDYFSKYFGWDTWVEIAQCTNKQSNMLNPVTAKEVAQFVGIHIAMGTLKFPSLKLYWQDFTKVPLIAEAMPLSQFLQLSHKLKLACPAEDPVNTVRLERLDHDMQNAQQTATITGAMSSSNNSRNGQISQLSDGQSQRGKPNELSNLSNQTDPLWRVQPLLCRFQAGCQLLSQEGDYAVDQYPLPLTTRKANNNKFSLHCTTLIGFGGLILHLDLKLDLADKEDAVEKMVPRGSMVFLCKQELSTPAMLERLLVAGVHGAGRVGGARGQIGDEFVSSDGKLMLRRSNRGFILSTVGYSQRNMASLTDNFEKAQMSARLNRDLQSLYCIPLTASAPTCWPQAVLWYLTDLALVNSWLLYRQDQGTASEPLTLMAFRLEVSKALILSSGSDTQDSVPPQPPTQKAHTTSETPNPNLLEESPLPDAATRYDGSGHWPEQLGEGEGGRCRFGGCERTSRVLCLKCCVFLCISRNHNCFLNFHNQGSLGNE